MWRLFQVRAVIRHDGVVGLGFDVERAIVHGEEGGTAERRVRLRRFLCTVVRQHLRPDAATFIHYLFCFTKVQRSAALHPRVFRP